jgi:hypothetical protein
MVRNPAAVRMPDEIRQYRFGRYVNATDRFVMHESHPVFRIERSARWDLRPDSGEQPLAASAPTNQTTVESSDAFLAEINKQKAATKAFTEQTSMLNQRLQDLSGELAETKKIAQENLLLKQRIGGLTTRLDALETKSRETSTRSAPKPSPTVEENW